VVVNFVVEDKSGIQTNGLTHDDFVVSENKVRRHAVNSALRSSKP
jgi:hypothetical protein